MEDTKEQKMDRERKGISRRDFLKMTGFAGLGLAFGLRPRRVEAEGFPVHLDAIEVADLNPDSGGRPIFRRTEEKAGEDLLAKSDFSTVSKSISDALKAVGDILQEKNIKVDGVTAVVQGIKKEVPGKEPTVTPTPPTKDKNVPVLVSFIGGGIEIDNDKSWFYSNIDPLKAMEVTKQEDVPANLYVFPAGNTLFAADYRNAGVVYAQGTTNDQKGFEWTKVEHPQKSEWNLASDKPPVLSQSIVEVIRDGREKAVMIPDTAIAVSIGGLSQKFWNNYDEALKKTMTDPRYLKILGLSKPLDIEPTHDLIIYPSELTGKTDKQAGDIITDFVKSLRTNLRSLDYLDREAKVVSIEPNKLQPQMAILFFDYSDSDQKISEFYKEKFGFDISADDVSKLKWTTAGFPQTRVFEALRVYDGQTNTEFMLVSIPTDSYDLISRMFDAIVVANTTNTKDIKVGMRTDAAEKILNVFSIKCKGVDKNAHIYGLLGSTAGIGLLQTICKK